MAGTLSSVKKSWAHLLLARVQLGAQASFCGENFYLGREAAGVPGVVWVAKGLAYMDEPVFDFSLADRRKKRQSQSPQRNGRIDNLAKKASKNPRFLDLRVRSL
jgi:hypothetical protein